MGNETKKAQTEISLAAVGGLKGFEALAKENPGVLFTWDAGEGWRSEAVYEPRLRRVRYVSINPVGARVV